MRGRKALLVVLLAAAAALPQASQAQFSPGGIIGTFTHPLRSMLGRFGHFPRRHRSHAEQEHEAQTPSARFGDVGPTGWSRAYEDIVGFTFWPGRYAGQIRMHGFDVVADALTSPGRAREVARNTTGAAVQSDSNGNAADACGPPPTARVEWPASQIEQDGKLDDAQRAALGKMQDAVNEAIKTVKSGCRDVHGLPPLDRLKATVQELWTARDAGIYIRTPLKTFYESLNDQQKKDFVWKQPDQRARPNAKSDGKPDNGAMAKQYQACAAPSLEASQRLVRQIEQEVQPRAEQDQAMQDLRKTITDMAKLTTAPCGLPIPPDPVARLDAVNDQLSNLSYAATSLEIALDGLYAGLDDAQKAKFDSIGR
ncbi:MAG TPA: Spy/CpxP family protein refolding chaperone [Pseudolabrys sp.]|nr:Spy/CpxP family protein refolding chaperone [Pseudolabrys sp.]